MELRKTCSILLAVLMSVTLLSCGAKKPKPELTVESYTELQTIQKLPPVYVPGGSWTEADIPGALWVGAHPFSYPATFSALGGKFSIDPEAFSSIITGQGEITATLLYDGCACGVITLSDCTTLENYNIGKIRSLDFHDCHDSEHPAPALFPICFSGITIGSTAEQIKNNLGIDAENGLAVISTSHHTIKFNVSPTEGVTSIILISEI